MKTGSLLDGVMSTAEVGACRDRLSAGLKRVLGEKGWLTDRLSINADASDWLGRTAASPIGVAKPASVEEVSAVVKLCRSAGVCITPQGGNTGLVGGALSMSETPGIILSTSRLGHRLEIDPVGMTVTVDAGVVLSRLHEALEPSGLMLPLHLGSGGTAQIGGLIATNAGGSHAMRFGTMMDQVLGLEVVLADGAIWNGMRPLIKDNAGYQLRKLFCGSEGTLGIITGAVLRLLPAPRKIATALVAVPDWEAAVAFGQMARLELAEILTGLEFFSDLGVELLRRHLPHIVFPLDIRSTAYVLIEVGTGLAVDPDSHLQGLLEQGFEAGSILDGVVAASEKQRRDLWHLREEIPEAQRLEGIQLKHDISVPVSSLAEFIHSAREQCTKRLAGVRINSFGHLGDGNIHFNLSPPPGGAGFSGVGDSLSECIYRLSVQMGGSFAAEHGLGSLKVDHADRLRPAVERDVMRHIKHALDPENLLNPRTVV